MSFIIDEIMKKSDFALIQCRLHINHKDLICPHDITKVLMAAFIKELALSDYSRHRVICR